MPKIISSPTSDKKATKLKINITAGGFFALLMFIALFVLGLISGFNGEISRQNLFYSLAAAILSLFIIGLPIAFLNISRIYISRTVPKEIVAGSSFSAIVKVKNHSKNLPRFAIKITDLFPHSNDAPELLSKPVINEGYCVSIPVRKTAVLRFRTVIPTRGVISLTNITFSSLFPFSLLKLTKIVEAKSEITIFPKPIKTTDFTSKFNGFFQSLSGNLQPRRASIDEYFGIREFKNGDNPRFIHWKASARKNSLMMKEFLEESLPPVLILLDTQILNRKRLRFALEKAISIVADVSAQITNRNQRLAFMADNIEIKSGTGQKHFERILSALAHINPKNEDKIENIASKVNPKFHADCAVFVITLRELHTYKFSDFSDKLKYFHTIYVNELTISRF